MTTPPASIPTPHGTGNIRHVVQHECGHAAASWALGIPFARIALSGSHGPAVYPIPGGTRIKRGHDWVIKACGVIADQQPRGLSMRGSQIARLVLGGDGRFEVDDAATGQVAIRPSRAPAVRQGGDLHEMAEFFASMPRAQAAPEVIRLWRECERFAGELRPAIDALADAVLARGELSYSEASAVAAAAMADRPVPVLADWLQ